MKNSNKALVAHLIKQYKTHKNLIIAFDYDNTIFPYNKYCDDDLLNAATNVLKDASNMGMTLILFTCRHHSDNEEMIDWCTNAGIKPDYINTDCEHSPIKGRGKIYYNIFLDDKAGLGEAIATLEEAINLIKQL